jgi:hypothetical protein
VTRLTAILVGVAVGAMLATLATLVAHDAHSSTAALSALEAPSCAPSRVHYTPYPGGDSLLRRLPWIRGTPRKVGLVGLLWYWPAEWQRRRVRQARIFAGGTAPAGYSTKILWVFTSPRAQGRAGRLLVVRGRRLDQPGSFTQQFAAISYAGQRGAPSYASIVDVPSPGCWRLRLETGTLRATVELLAVAGSPPPAEDEPVACAEDEVRALVDRFVGAFNAGELETLDAIFAQEPDFEWYSTGAPGERLLPQAGDRESLVPYFRQRHELGERLLLRTFRFNGNTLQTRPYGNFVYTLTRSAGDLPPTEYVGKGAARCYRTRPDVIFVWSMAPAQSRRAL